MIGTVGPSWCDTAAKVQSGDKDLTFIRQSIVEPNAAVPAGYAANVMPTNFAETFTANEIEALVNFIGNLDCS